MSDDEIRSLVDYMLRASGIEQPLLLAAQRYDALGLTQREFIALDQDRNAELLRQIQQRLNSVAGMVRDAQLARQALQRHPLDAGATQPGQPADAGGDTAV